MEFWRLFVFRKWCQKQPLQQNLSQNKHILVNVEIIDWWQHLRRTVTPIQKTKYYRKTVFNAVEIFEYSNDAQQELFNVRFTLVGTNIGNYIITNSATISRFYEYIPPVNDSTRKLWPIIQLIAPTKVQFYRKIQTNGKNCCRFWALQCWSKLFSFDWWRQ
jgi:hypothetical protein